MSKTMKGALMTLIAGIAWGLSGACGQYLLAHGFTAIGLTTIRLVFSGAVLLLLAYLADQEKVKAFLTDRSSYIPLLLFAFLGLLMTQLTYLEAIDATNAGTATVFQYLCPIGVLAYSCVKDRVAPTVSEIFSMILAIAGTFLIATHGQLNRIKDGFNRPLTIGKELKHFPFFIAEANCCCNRFVWIGCQAEIVKLESFWIFHCCTGNKGADIGICDLVFLVCQRFELSKQWLDIFFCEIQSQLMQFFDKGMATR